MFRPTGQEVRKVDGCWQYNTGTNSKWIPGQWLVVTDPRFFAELEAEEAAGDLTETLAEQYARQMVKVQKVFIEVHRQAPGAAYHREAHPGYDEKPARPYPLVPEGYLAKFIMPPCRSGHSMFVFEATVGYAQEHGLRPCPRCFLPQLPDDFRLDAIYMTRKQTERG